MKNLDLSGFVNHAGQPLDLMSASFKAAPRRQRDGDARWHKGWVVEGHKPGALETAQKAIEEACALWAGLSAADQAAAIKKGERAPRPWDELVWRETTKLRRVRARPYEVPQAATECKALAERAGWLDVRVVELKKN